MAFPYTSNPDRPGLQFSCTIRTQKRATPTPIGGTVRDGMGRYGTVWDSVGGYGSGMGGTGGYGTVWDSMGGYGRVWEGMGRYGGIWERSRAVRDGTEQDFPENS